MASISDLVTVGQNQVTATNNLQKTYAQTVPVSTSGTLAADTLIQTGFVRVTGISVVVAGAAGGLYDAATIAAKGSGNLSYVTQATINFDPVNMVFANGLVYSPGSGQTVVVYYTRV